MKRDWKYLNFNFITFEHAQWKVKMPSLWINHEAEA